MAGRPVKELLAEIKAFGYNGIYTLLATFLSAYPRSEVEPALPPVRKGANFSSRRISRLLNQPPAEWSADEEAFLTHLLSANESIRQVHELSEQFRQLMREKSAVGLAKWCEDAEKWLAMRVLFGAYVRTMRLLSKPSALSGVTVKPRAK